MGSASAGHATQRSTTSVLIGLYYYHPYLSGLSEYARRLAEGLVRAGCRVTVVCTRHETDLPEESWIEGVRVIRAPVLWRHGKGVLSPAFWWRLVRLAKNHDFVNLHLPLPDAGLVAPFLDPRGLLLTYHCDVNLGDAPLDRAIEGISYRLMDVAMKRAAAIVGNSDSYFRSCRFSGYGAKYRTIHPPVDTKLFGSGGRSERPPGKHKELPYTIGFVGRIVYEKGLQYLFEAIPHLRRSLGDIRVLVAGDSSGVAGGSVMDELRPYREAHPDTIRFLGRLSADELVEFYHEIDVLVLPSIDPLESFGMVQVEAMCCGTPVVASDLPGVDEVIGATGFGRLAEARDSADLARQIALVHEGRYRSADFDPARWDTAATVDRYLRLMAELSERS